MKVKRKVQNQTDALKLKIFDLVLNAKEIETGDITGKDETQTVKPVVSAVTPLATATACVKTKIRRGLTSDF